jgi:hypothetical protein
MIRRAEHFRQRRGPKVGFNKANPPPSMLRQRLRNRRTNLATAVAMIGGRENDYTRGLFRLEEKDLLDQAQ